MKKHTIQEPPVKPIPGTNKYRLLFDIELQVLGTWYTIDAGFEFDGASIPWIAQPFSYNRYDPLVLGPACFHDWLYRTHAVSRLEGDRYFQMLLRANDVPVRKARRMFWAVQLFGRRAWNKHSGDGLAA